MVEGNNQIITTINYFKRLASQFGHFTQLNHVSSFEVIYGLAHTPTNQIYSQCKM